VFPGWGPDRFLDDEMTHTQRVESREWFDGVCWVGLEREKHMYALVLLYSTVPPRSVGAAANLNHRGGTAVRTVIYW